jgi:hypothetical protein
MVWLMGENRLVLLTRWEIFLMEDSGFEGSRWLDLAKIIFIWSGWTLFLLF